MQETLSGRREARRVKWNYRRLSQTVRNVAVVFIIGMNLSLESVSIAGLMSMKPKGRSEIALDTVARLLHTFS